MKRTVLMLIALVMIAGFVVGCGEKFTQKRFDHMIMNGQSKMEVEKILGKPDARWTNKWKWVNFDKHFSAVVLFSEGGSVVGKAWSDSERQDTDPETKWRKGDWPEKEEGSGDDSPTVTTPGNSSSTTTEMIVD